MRVTHSGHRVAIDARGHGPLIGFRGLIRQSVEGRVIEIPIESLISIVGVLCMTVKLYPGRDVS